MEKGILEIITEEAKPDTLTSPELYKEPKKVLIASDMQMKGSRIFLYKLRFSNWLIGSYIVPSDYFLDNKRVLQLEQGVNFIYHRFIYHRATSRSFRDFSIDQLNVKLLDKLLPPNPIGTKYFQDHKPRLIRHFFSLDSEELLIEIVKGLL
ncbi:hypothetical protein HYW75_01970 [Candidatus Pacearchaeota archaeon]|nr:hypothetical protein [Candidatus Pacearchaeota archaeon]